MGRILITGGHSGIGLELTKILLNEGHHIGLIMRNEKRRDEVLQEFQNGAAIDFFFADLSNQRDIQKVIGVIKAAWTHIDILFNNAGVLLKGHNLSEQGNEMHYEVNTLAPYLLAVGLKELLLQSQNPTVLNTSTTGLQNGWYYVGNTLSAKTDSKVDVWKTLAGSKAVVRGCLW